jgi:uncharacterized membrane protein YccC
LSYLAVGWCGTAVTLQCRPKMNPRNAVAAINAYVKKFQKIAITFGVTAQQTRSRRTNAKAVVLSKHMMTPAPK